MNNYDYGDNNPSIAILAGNEEEKDRDGANGADMSGQKKRKRWKTLLDNLIHGRKRKSTKVRQVLKESVSADIADVDGEHHVLMVMESLHQAEERMSTDGRNKTPLGKQTATGDDNYDDGSGAECILYTEQQPNKKMKVQQFDYFDIPATISEDDDESTIWGVQSLGSWSTHGMVNGTLRPVSSDLESILSVWSVLNRVDMVALFQDVGEEEVELMLVEEDIRDIVMDKPWAFTPEDRWKILDAYADVNDILDDDDAFDVCTVVSCSGVSSLSGNSACHIPIALTFTCRSRAMPTVNPWAAAKRGDMKALTAIAVTHDPSIWMTEDAFEATPLQYACQSGARSEGPEVVLYLLEQCPTGGVPRHILERCRDNATDRNIVRILNGDQKYIEEVKDRTLVSRDDNSDASLPLLLGEGEI